MRDGVVYGRSKPDIDPATKWSPAKQLFPPVLAPDTTPHDPATIPAVCPLQEWKNGAEVQKDLGKFYANKMRYVVTKIPSDVSEGAYREMGCPHTPTYALTLHSHRNAGISRKHGRDGACGPRLD